MRAHAKILMLAGNLGECISLLSSETVIFGVLNGRFRTTLDVVGDFF